MTKDELTKWKKLQATLKTIKAQEFDLRKKLAEEVLKGKTGTVNIAVHGYKVKAQQSTRHKVDNEPLLSLWSDLTPDEQECVKWVPEIVKSKYKALTNKEMLNSVVTTVPNAPTLKIEIIK